MPQLVALKRCSDKLVKAASQACFLQSAGGHSPMFLPWLGGLLLRCLGMLSRDEDPCQERRGKCHDPRSGPRRGSVPSQAAVDGNTHLDGCLGHHVGRGYLDRLACKERPQHQHVTPCLRFAEVRSFVTQDLTCTSHSRVKIPKQSF